MIEVSSPRNTQNDFHLDDIHAAPHLHLSLRESGREAPGEGKTKRSALSRIDILVTEAKFQRHVPSAPFRVGRTRRSRFTASASALLHLIILVAHHRAECPSFANCTAFTPNATENAIELVGAPPRCRCPRRTRASLSPCVAQFPLRPGRQFRRDETRRLRSRV